jgi:hypothetical protein
MWNSKRTDVRLKKTDLWRRTTDLGLYIAIGAATALLAAVVIEVEFKGNLTIALFAFFICGVLTYLDGRIRSGISRLAVLLSCALAFGLVYLWLR